MAYGGCLSVSRNLQSLDVEVPEIPDGSDGEPQPRRLIIRITRCAGFAGSGDLRP